MWRKCHHLNVLSNACCTVIWVCVRKTYYLPTTVRATERCDQSMDCYWLNGSFVELRTGMWTNRYGKNAGTNHTSTTDNHRLRNSSRTENRKLLTQIHQIVFDSVWFRITATSSKGEKTRYQISNVRSVNTNNIYATTTITIFRISLNRLAATFVCWHIRFNAKLSNLKLK